MPVIKYYQGRPVDRIRRVPGGVEVVFTNTQAGERKERQIVTQEEWQEHGTTTYLPEKVDVRSEAAKLTGEAR
jgi:hypothetical protein